MKGRKRLRAPARSSVRVEAFAGGEAVITFRIIGDLDELVCGVLRNAVIDAFELALPVTVDCSRMGACETAAAEQLVQLVRRSRRVGHALSFTGVPPSLVGLLGDTAGED
jgi:anti-anti-sigma regulatory factor